MSISPWLAPGAVLAALAIGSAGVASAEPLSGSYTATVTGAFGNYLSDRSPTWVLTPCGPGCVNVDAQGAQLHEQDGRWTGTFEVRAADNREVVVCTRTITAELTASDMCPQPLGLMVNYQLTKNG